MSPRLRGGMAAAEVAALKSKVASLTYERDRLIVERDAAKSASYRDGQTLANLRSELESVVEDRDEVESERFRLDAELQLLSTQRSAWLLERGVTLAFVPVDQLPALLDHLRVLRGDEVVWS